MLSIAEQIEAARPHFNEPKPDPKQRARTLSFREQVHATLPKTNGITTPEIGERVGIHKSTICESLKDLKKHGRAKVIGKLNRFDLWVRT
jgi:ribosomal protein S25